MTFRPMLWPTLFALPALAILIVLGNWQMDRLAWKEGLLAQIEQGMSADPAPLPTLDSWKGLEEEVLRYTTARVTGTFDHQKEAHIYIASIDGQPGYHVVTPLELASGGWVLVDRGFVPINRKAPENRPAGQVTGEVTVEGVLVTPDEANSFTPEPDLVENIWYHRPVARLAARAAIDPVFPLLLDAGGAPNAGGLPVGGQTRLELNNPHLGYAMTWYGLAVTLAGVWLAFHISRRRIGFGA
ncbi:MAG: SURF1 family protein [Candidatus Phaeomarinobacter sp.]